MLCPPGNQPEHDLVETPASLARAIVNHFRPTGTCLDPARGEGAFFNAMLSKRNIAVDWCEVREGRDFFNCDSRWNWIITNPPWSKFKPFLAHSLRLANEVVFLATLTHFVTRARLELIRTAGFGLREALLAPQPPLPWPPSGFQLAAVWLSRGWTGNLHFDSSMLTSEMLEDL